MIDGAICVIAVTATDQMADWIEPLLLERWTRI